MQGCLVLSGIGRDMPMFDQSWKKGLAMRPGRWGTNLRGPHPLNYRDAGRRGISLRSSNASSEARVDPAQLSSVRQRETVFQSESATLALNRVSHLFIDSPS
jgi:hypothetical protein